MGEKASVIFHFLVFLIFHFFVSLFFGVEFRQKKKKAVNIDWSVSRPTATRVTFDLPECKDFSKKKQKKNMKRKLVKKQNKQKQKIVWEKRPKPNDSGEVKPRFRHKFPFEVFFFFHAFFFIFSLFWLGGAAWFLPPLGGVAFSPFLLRAAAFLLLLWVGLLSPPLLLGGAA